jgi:hypothetical protein
MRVIKSTAALCVSLSAIFAASALAGVPVASAAQWHVAGSTLTGSAGYTGKSTGAFTFSFSSGGVMFALHAAGVETLESSLANEGETAGGRTKIRFTGVTTEGLGGCAVRGGTITTYPLKTVVESAEGHSYDVFKAVSGDGLFNWSLGEGTGSCPLAGSYGAYGEFAAPEESLTTEALTHELSFSETVQGAFYKAFHTNSRSAKMWTNMGPAPASFTGSLSESLTGSYAGQTWSAS